MRITGKGQVTIPAEVREKAGLLPGTGVLRVPPRRRPHLPLSPLSDFCIGAHAQGKVIAS
ncbi:AbrB/MazE/SpoVT family DNA-binding domain-containing protein [Benzoatithermus flavus]|uniref:AbrB/MazE/SpoVT family DNA-binding domain-containing protein n=1 Tax=Benzoatithermus flavus TaxID=3108223 RepID=UPI003AAD2345